MVINAKEPLYRGKRLGDMTRGELVDIVKVLGELYTQQLEKHIQEREFERSLRR